MNRLPDQLWYHDSRDVCKGSQVKHVATEILVIGGGATGLGIAWDAALRGFKVVLVEKGDLGHGTSGRYHGLLHSGGRYVISDPQSAAECIVENRILRKILTHCIEDTGGYFIVTPEDEGNYPDRFKSACGEIGIPCEEVPITAALRQEPNLNPAVSRVFAVSDASADSFQAGHSVAQAAQEAGARILIYHRVEELSLEGSGESRRVAGARVLDLISSEETTISADLTINATGAWAGQLGKMAGLAIDVIPGKGTMLALNRRLTNTVLNRCKPPGDGDILVPIQTVAVIGTTDERVQDPENLSIEPWEVELLMREGEKMVPAMRAARIVRAWAGVRPLYQEGHAGTSREATRAFTLLDHRARDGVSGLLTILGGKWTTFRLMAEKTVDKACDHLGMQRACVTATTPVPGAERGHYWLGHRLKDVEQDRLQADLICECELVTRAMLEDAARNNPTHLIDDLRRDLRLGMGPCQGGFCTFRAAGVLHELGPQGGSDKWNAADMQSPAAHAGSRTIPAAVSAGGSVNPNLLLRDFLQERWKGLRPILWGAQLKQQRLDELIYLSLLNIDHLPEEEEHSPMSGFYAADPPQASSDA
ncbi:MAG: anaerobic glycerol-3-phosphate dehydrogenase subunit GlpA [Rudaea sp.]